MVRYVTERKMKYTFRMNGSFLYHILYVFYLVQIFTATHFQILYIKECLCFLLSNGYRVSFPVGKARPGSDADHSPPSGVEVKKE
jgi:hypothetical protein